METKYYVINNDNFDKTLPELSIRIPANGRTEIPGDFARILVRQFEVRQITIESWKEINNVDYKEFLEGNVRIKNFDNKKEEITKKSKK